VAGDTPLCWASTFAAPDLSLVGTRLKGMSLSP
jgi:hypothetical protein